MESDLTYCEQLEAHIDEGGLTSAINVRDLIQMVREAHAAITAAERQGMERAAKWHEKKRDWCNPNSEEYGWHDEAVAAIRALTQGGDGNV